VKGGQPGVEEDLIFGVYSDLVFTLVATEDVLLIRTVRPCNVGSTRTST
jgi:hypothetical protein